MTQPGSGLTLVEQLRSKKRALDRLLEEALFMFDAEIRARGIKTHTVTGRVKSEDSVIGKADAKGYADPLDEMEDLVGVRAVCLFLSDLPRLRAVVDETFFILEEEDKTSGPEGGTGDTFGYMSVHYVCKLRPEYVGPRYSGLSDLRFEVQCRTILMDAWANVSHYLSYKGERSIPEHLRRDFYALSGLFYVADQHFQLFFGDSLTSRREALASAAGASQSPPSDQVPLNLDTTMALLEMRYPSRDSSSPDIVSEFVEEIAPLGYKTVADLERELDRGDAAALIYEQDNPPGNNIPRFAAIGIARQALGIANPAYERLKYGGTGKDFTNYRHYLTDRK